MRHLLLVGLAALGLQSCRSQAVKVVPSVDLQRYIGTWYEIARLPNQFQQDLKCVTANYTLKDDGTIQVINRGINAKNGREESAKGKARRVKGAAEGLLEVSFFLSFYQDYQIIALDSNYQYAVVGNRALDYLWILSRSTEMSETLYQNLVSEAAKNGYDTKRLLQTLHDCVKTKNS